MFELVDTGSRPQQGLTIMNWIKLYMMDYDETFPSPTGVNHYELRQL